MNTFIYGVFSTVAEFNQALSGLKSLGLDDVVIMKNTGNPSYQSASLQTNLKAQMIAWGVGGAVLGGIAGIVASPSTNLPGVYQVLTPMMAMVSGGVLFAYFAVWVCGFLNWIDRPVLEHEVFEGNIANGAMLLGVTVADGAQKFAVMECFDAAGATELITRNEEAGRLEGHAKSERVNEEAPVSSVKLVA